MAFIKTSSKGKTNEPTYEVLEKYGIVGKRNGDWQLELRFISWNGNEPKYDLRPWKETDEGEMCSKGITMSGEEMEKLLSILKEMEQKGKGKENERKKIQLQKHRICRHERQNCKEREREYKNNEEMETGLLGGIMLTREMKNGFYIVYLDGKFLTTCDNYQELREVYAEFGITI